MKRPLEATRAWSWHVLGSRWRRRADASALAHCRGRVRRCERLIPSGIDAGLGVKVFQHLGQNRWWNVPTAGPKQVVDVRHAVRTLLRTVVECRLLCAYSTDAHIFRVVCVCLSTRMSVHQLIPASNDNSWDLFRKSRCPPCVAILGRAADWSRTVRARRTVLF